VWRPIPSCLGYEASNLGRIRSVRIKVLKPVRIHATIGGDTHEIVSIASRKKLVHRLVDEAFRGPRPEGIIVHHQDNNMVNNRIKNLKRVTYSQNTLYAYRDGRIGRRQKLNPLQRRKVVETYRAGLHSTRSLSEQFGVSKSCIARVLNGAGVRLHGMRKFTPRQCKDMLRKKKRGASIAKLAIEYGVTEGAIRHRFAANAEAEADPLGTGKFKARAPNHPIEGTTIAGGK